MPTHTMIRFEGGPLDGQERRKHAPGRHPLYLTVEGAPLDTTKGDRIVNAVRGLRHQPVNAVRACYIRTDAEQTTYRYITS
jgi:hypothetical protein